MNQQPPPPTDRGQPEGAQPVETRQEYHARYEINRRVAREEITRFYDRKVEGGILAQMDTIVGLMYETDVMNEASKLQNNPTLDWEARCEATWRNPDYKRGVLDAFNRVKPSAQVNRLFLERNARKRRVERREQEEPRAQEPQVQVMMENLQLEHDDGAGGDGDGEEWVMVDQAQYGV